MIFVRNHLLFQSVDMYDDVAMFSKETRAIFPLFIYNVFMKGILWLQHPVHEIMSEKAGMLIFKPLTLVSIRERLCHQARRAGPCVQPGHSLLAARFKKLTLTSLILIIDWSKFKVRKVHYKNSAWKEKS